MQTLYFEEKNSEIQNYQEYQHIIYNIISWLVVLYYVNPIILYNIFNTVTLILPNATLDWWIFLPIQNTNKFLCQVYITT